MPSGKLMIQSENLLYMNIDANTPASNNFSPGIVINLHLREGKKDGAKGDFLYMYNSASAFSKTGQFIQCLVATIKYLLHGLNAEERKFYL